MKIETTKERILQFIDYKEISVSTFLHETNIKRGFLDGDKLKSTVSDIFITKIIAKYPEINIKWLLTGEGEMLRTRNTEISLIYGELDKGGGRDRFKELLQYIEELKDRNELLEKLRESDKREMDRMEKQLKELLERLTRT